MLALKLIISVVFLSRFVPRGVWMLKVIGTNWTVVDIDVNMGGRKEASKEGRKGKRASVLKKLTLKLLVA